MGAEAEATTVVARQLADLEQLADVGYWTFDIASQQATWSRGLCRLYGVEPATFDPTFDSWMAMVHPDDRVMIGTTITAAIERCGDYEFDHRLHRASDGALRWTRCRGRVQTGPEGGAATIFGISIDTTAEQSSAMILNEFMANAAHELRTPAAAIGQAVQALRYATTDADRDEVLAVLHRQASRLRVLTVNLVDLAHIESGPAAVLLDSVELGPAVATAAVDAPAPDGRRLEVDVDDRLLVHADRHQLDRVLVNLLTNAWRYGGGTVSVTASANDDGRVMVLVHDDGDGVPPEVVEHVFEPFRRGPQRHPEASGLGLAIVARLMQRFGGSVDYRDGDGGATFALEFEAG